MLGFCIVSTGPDDVVLGATPRISRCRPRDIFHNLCHPGLDLDRISRAFCWRVPFGFKKSHDTPTNQSV